MELAFAGALVLGVVLLIVGEFNGKLALRAPSKVVASTAFIALAFAHGSIDGAVGAWLLAALIGCWLGDVLLLGESRPMFLGGLVAFLLGHLAFAGAFGVAGLDLRVAGVTIGVLVVPAVIVFRWLKPHLPKPMLGPVLAYMVVISVMVAAAAGRFAVEADPRIMIAAVMFYVSDLAVARNRFVAKGPMNRLWGLPLYYGAMALLALGV
jgi:uncharacterized membrane protein YhhN